MHTNRFYEFVQGEEVGKEQVGLRSVFDEPKKGYANEIWDSRAQELVVDARGINMWQEYFGRF